MHDCRQYFAATGRRVTFEYTLMAGVNASPQDVSSCFGAWVLGWVLLQMWLEGLKSGSTSLASVRQSWAQVIYTCAAAGMPTFQLSLLLQADLSASFRFILTCCI